MSNILFRFVFFAAREKWIPPTLPGVLVGGVSFSLDRLGWEAGGTVEQRWRDEEKSVGNEGGGWESSNKCDVTIYFLCGGVREAWEQGERGVSEKTLFS